MGRLAAELGIEALVAVGPDAAAIADGAQSADLGGPQVQRVDTLDSAQALLENLVAPGDIVLLKSSRDAGLRLLGDRLIGQEAHA